MTGRRGQGIILRRPRACRTAPLRPCRASASPAAAAPGAAPPPGRPPRRRH